MVAITHDMCVDFADYAKINKDSAEAESFVQSAIEYCESRTGKEMKMAETMPENNLYWLCVKMVATHWHDNRGVSTDKAEVEIPLAAEELLNHISLSSSF